MARTFITIPGHAEIILPGAKTVDGVRAVLGAEIPGLASMDGVAAAPAAGTGDTRITFSQRSGNKG